MSLRARINRIENGHRYQFGEWEAPWFVVRDKYDVARCDAEMERWKEEIKRDKARGRLTFGFDFRLGEDDDTRRFPQPLEQEREP